MRDRVFEPFVQGDLGLSKKYGGTGLGLSICSQLANLMGGSIVLESEEGVGSTFTMKIPLKHTKSRAPSTSSSDAHVSRPNSVYSNGDVNQNRISSKRAVDKNIENDSQPRLVGLSQPFFASNPAPSSGTAGKRSDEQLAALDSVTAEKEPGTVNVSSCLAHFRAFNICLKPSLTRWIGSKLRVLVAEDNLVNQEVVLRMLKLEDVYDVVVAKDGQEAYDLVKQSMSKNEYFDLIFMDIQVRIFQFQLDTLLT